MKTLRRWLKYRARIRYWKSRAEASEQRVIDLQASLDAERWRNMEREDTMVSASVMGQRGMWGMPPRTGPALQSQQSIGNHIPSLSAWDKLPWADRNEFDLFWKSEAEAAGVSIASARQRFINEVVIPRRLPLNDEPFGQH